METQSLPSLRPLRLGELLDQAIRLYRRNFLTFIGIIALVYVPLTVLQTAATTVLSSSLSSMARSSSPDEIFSNYAYWGGILSTLVVSFLQFIFVSGIATGALTRAVADNYLGKTTSILDAYRGIGKSWLPLIGGLLFVGLLIIAAALWWVIVPCIGWFTGFGMLVFLGAAISPMVAPVVVLENRGALDSVRRAWDLVRRRFWPVLGYIFVLYLFNLIIVNGPVTLVNILLTRVLPLSFNDSTTGIVLVAIIQAIVSLVFILIYYPLQMTAFTLIYFDLRVRTEGFDLTLLTTGDADQALAASPSQSNERFMTGADLGNFAILTLAAVGVYIFFVAIVAAGLFLLGSLSGL
jgi:hypothetical protein